jgi:hypothetical protein
LSESNSGCSSKDQGHPPTEYYAVDSKQPRNEWPNTAAKNKRRDSKANKQPDTTMDKECNTTFQYQPDKGRKGSRGKKPSGFVPLGLHQKNASS